MKLLVHPAAQYALKGAVEPLVPRQALEPRRRARKSTPLRIQGDAIGQVVHGVKLATSGRRGLEELEALPIGTFEEDRTVLAFVPGAELRAPVLGRPESDAKHPASRCRAAATA